jgi:hypothetical protein
LKEFLSAGKKVYSRRRKNSFEKEKEFLSARERAHFTLK